MALTVGSRVGHYEVTALIGEGGMGQVYRATDTKLNRQVALKILPEPFASDPDRLARFQREAQVLASLNHPGIAGIYGLEESGDTRALVLELVEGPTLADRIAKGPIPIDEALPIAKQIAEALEAAHEAGVIHRDLKPANIKVKDDGTVKVLDFGLAKALDPTPEGDPSQSPTLTAAATQMGVIMGTAAYMSPEQARGKPTDRRADIWAFGAVLFEMLTAKRAFEGEDVSVTLANVINQRPNWDVLPPGIGPSVRRYLQRCLEKEPTQRVQAIGDVRLAMEGAFETTVGTSSTQGTDPTLHIWQRPIPALVVGLALLVVGGLGGWTLTRSSPALVARFPIPLEGRLPSFPGQHLALSPDGQNLVYVVAGEAPSQIYLRSLHQIEAAPLRGTEGVRDVFWSPDGAWVGFQTDGMLKKVAVAGGEPETLCDCAQGAALGASWGFDNTIVFGNGLNSPLMRVSAFGGVPEPATSFRADEGEGIHGRPQILPGGAILFTVIYGSNARIAVQPLGAGEHRVVLADGRSARYVPTGHLVFVREGAIWMVPFDVDGLEVTGPASPLVQDVLVTVGSLAQFSVANNGSLVYATGGSLAQTETLVWLDHDGRVQPTNLPPGNYSSAHLSSDGTQMSLFDNVRGELDLWVSEVERDTLSRFTTDPAVDAWGVWTPDGKAILFVSNRVPPWGVFSKATDGSGEVEQLVTVEEARNVRLWGRLVEAAPVLVTYDLPSTGWDVGAFSLDGPSALQPVLASEANEDFATVSPDGGWVAYQSDESGDWEIYVEKFPEGGQRERISDGGVKPLWSPDGDVLFYAKQNAMMSAPMELGQTLTAGRPMILFEASERLDDLVGGIQDLSPDGRRFLAIMTAKHTGAEATPQPQLILVQNWLEELKQRVPVR